MAEYIEREALLKVLRGSAVAKYPASFAMGLFAAADEVSKLPAADVQTVVHGRWEHLEVGWFGLWRCSACGDEWTFGYDPTADDLKVKYRPNCGARMDGE